MAGASHFGRHRGIGALSLVQWLWTGKATFQEANDSEPEVSARSRNVPTTKVGDKCTSVSNAADMKAACEDCSCVQSYPHAKHDVHALHFGLLRLLCKVARSEPWAAPGRLEREHELLQLLTRLHGVQKRRC